MKQIEILAPAGSYEGLTAAVRASCDAVYIGGNKFGARAYADNPAEDNMLKAIDYAHLHDKKIYLTVNTLLKNSELEDELYTYLSRYYEQGLDAVIVQDIGVMHFVHNYFPDLPIHASTQMTLTMAKGANILKPMGISRLVNSRELSLEEIKQIKVDTDLEIESFVHGALCYCYSGQCFMSSMLGGRSGNRGRCAQPCRMPYKLRVDNRMLMNSKEKYLLSPKDICTIDMIPDLIEAGIDSFKIEGRMKRPEYAAGVTLTYRKYVDKYLELGKERYEAFLFDHSDMLRSDQLILQDLYNRGGFSSGYYSMRNGKTMMSIERPNHSGVYVGEVRKVKESQAMIHLAEELNPQDIIEIRDAADVLYEFTVKNHELKNSGYWINLHRDSKVSPGNSVYRTKNNLLLTDLSERFLKEEIKEPIIGLLTVKMGERLKLELSCRDIHVTVEGEMAEEAKNQPMSKEKLEKQMLKTNDTSFAFEELSIILEGNVFIPVQKLNELRRNGLEALNCGIVGAHRRRAVKQYENTEKEYEHDHSKSKNGIIRPEIVVEIAREQQLVAACNHKEVTSIYLDSNIVPLSNLNTITKYIKSNNKKCYIVLPHIFRFVTYQMFQKHKSKLLDDTIDGYILQNYEEYEFVANVLKYKDFGKSILLNYNLYVMNYHAMQFWKEQGVTAFTAPIELNYQELKELRGMYQDIIVYGRFPLMVTAQCLMKTTSEEDGKSNQNIHGGKACCVADIKEIELIDRYQKNFPVRRNCRECYTTIYNSQSLSLLSNEQEVLHIQPKKVRLNFTIESAEEVDRILHAFIQVYRYQLNQSEVVSEFTRGHFKRGVE